jgi:4-diphosphocytidyl-2-C-methyl-D-erythritol kinase
MRLLTSAKINLNLKVSEQQNSGLHFLDSDMIPIDIYDDISINEAEEDKILFSIEPLNNEYTTVHKALALLRKINSSFKQQFVISVEKNIPLQSGLGGGSSDAGALLKYLVDTYQLEEPSMLEIATEVGSDVPFFYNGASSKVQGIGDVLKPFNSDTLNNVQVIIAVPNIHLSTGAVFNKFDELETKSTQKHEFNNIEIFNDLWEASSELSGDLKKIKNELENVFQNKFYMSGSGPTLFSLYDSKVENNFTNYSNNNLRYFKFCKKIECSLSQIGD